MYFCTRSFFQFFQTHVHVHGRVFQDVYVCVYQEPPCSTINIDHGHGDHHRGGIGNNGSSHNNNLSVNMQHSSTFSQSLTPLNNVKWFKDLHLAIFDNLNTITFQDLRYLKNDNSRYNDSNVNEIRSGERHHQYSGDYVNMTGVREIGCWDPNPIFNSNEFQTGPTSKTITEFSATGNFLSYNQNLLELFNVNKIFDHFDTLDHQWVGDFGLLEESSNTEAKSDCCQTVIQYQNSFSSLTKTKIIWANIMENEKTQTSFIIIATVTTTQLYHCFEPTISSVVKILEKPKISDLRRSRQNSSHWMDDSGGHSNISDIDGFDDPFKGIYKQDNKPKDNYFSNFKEIAIYELPQNLEIRDCCWLSNPSKSKINILCVLRGGHFSMILLGGGGRQVI